jgi:polysaccharide biosynthesis transport protein
MNELPDRDSWDVAPTGRMPARASQGPNYPEVWRAAGYPSATVEAQPEGSFLNDLSGYFWILFRHRWVILGIVVICLCIGFLITFLSTPIFRASMTIQIDREPVRYVNIGGVEGGVGNDWNDQAFYATQYEILKSRSLADKVVSDFSVEGLQEFTQHNVLSPWQSIRRAIGKMLPTANIPPEQQDVDVAALQRAAAYKVMGGLSVQPVGPSRIVRLSFEFPDPEWSQRVVNAVANTFVSLTLDRRFQSTTEARAFLEERLEELRLKLEDSEAKLVEYAQAQGIVNVEERQSLVSANLAAVAAQLSESSRERLRAEQLLRQADATGGLALPQILNDQSVHTMRERRAQLSAEYHDKLGFFKPEYPEMAMLQAQIDEIDRQIQESVDIAKASLRATYESARSQENSLTEELEALKAEVLDLDRRGIQYRILQREVDTNRELYDGILQRFKEVGVAGTVGTNNVSILDAAEQPGAPFKPRLSKNLTLALALGLFCGCVAAFGLEFIDDTFKVPEDVESILGLPVLGIVPIAATDDFVALALGDPRSSLAEAYRSLRTALQFSTADGVPSPLLVTSARPGEGKSTTAASLGRNFAQLGLNVLLIDADLRNPSLHEALGLSATLGLTNYLTGNSLPQGLFQTTDQQGLLLLASGPLPPNPAELLAGARMTSLLAVAGEKFDVVIVDGPPVMGLADAPLLASIARGTLLVVAGGQTRRTHVKAAVKRLFFARAQMVGVLLNKFNASRVGHGYGYGYGSDYGTSQYGYGGGDDVPKLAQPEA